VKNVKGLLSRKTSTGENFIDVIEQAFKDIGYTCEHKLFPIVKYGVPQKRERLIIVGWKDPAYVHKWPDEVDVDVSLKNILEFNMDGTIEVPKDLIDKAGVDEDSILIGKGEPCGVVHPYLIDRCKQRNLEYNGKQVGEYGFSFGKRVSAIHCEIVDIKMPSKTIISTYDHQPVYSWLKRLEISITYDRIQLTNSNRYRGFQRTM